MGSKTKNAIVNSYLALINNAEYDKVSVTDLVEKCNISRQTFYYHFDSINAMISWAFNRDINDACNGIDASTSLLSASQPNIEAMQKYTEVVRKASKAEDMVFLYETLQKCACKFLKEYLIRKSKLNLIGNYDYLIDTWACAIAARIIKEACSEHPDYGEILTANYNKMIKVFSAIK